MSKNIISTLVFLFFMTSIYAIEDRRLEQLSLSQYQLIKKHPIQSVYYGEGCYIKIWNRGQRNCLNGRNTFFYQVAKEGKLDKIAPLKAVIIDSEGECRGYATYPCRLISIRSQSMLNLDLCKKGLTPDEHLYVDLLKRMKRVTLEEGIFFNDLSPCNMGIRDEKCYFFDLDGIWDWEVYKRSFTGEAFCLSNPLIDQM